MFVSSISILSKAVWTWQNIIIRSWWVLEERNLYQPLSTDLHFMEKQRQHMDVVRFLSGLKSEYESVCA